MSDRRILVIQTAYIGDMVFTTPFLEGLKKKYPDSFLSILATPTAAQVLLDHPAVDEVIHYDKRGRDRGMISMLHLIRSLRSRKFHLMVSPHKSARTAIISLLSGAETTIGFSRGLHGRLYNRPVPFPKDEPRFARRIMALADALDIPKDRARPRLFISADRRGQANARLRSLGLQQKALLIGICFGSNFYTKRWPLERFAALAERLQSDCGAWVVLFGGPEEADEAKELASQLRETTLNRTGCSVAEMCAEIAHCNLFIGGDTGPTHIARALDVPSVLIFGPTASTIINPMPTDRIIERHPSCRPCGTHGATTCWVGTHECMQEIAVDQVFRAAQELLDLGGGVELRNAGSEGGINRRGSDEAFSDPRR